MPLLRPQRWRPASLRDGRTKRRPSRSGFALARTESQCITRPRVTNSTEWPTATKERLPPERKAEARLSCAGEWPLWFGEGTFARGRGNGKDAPIPDLPPPGHRLGTFGPKPSSDHVVESGRVAPRAVRPSAFDLEVPLR